MPVDRETMRGLAKKADYALNGSKKGDDRAHAFLITVFPRFPRVEDVEAFAPDFITSAKKAEYVAHLEALLAHFKATEMPF